MNRILKSLGRIFLAILTMTALSAVLLVVGGATQTDWLFALSLGVGMLSLASLSALLMARMTRQNRAARRAVKQVYDRQLNLAGYLENRLKDSRADSSQASDESLADARQLGSLRHGYGVDFDYAQRLLNGNGAVDTFALTSRSLAIRDSIALAATSGRWREADVTQFFRSHSLGRISKEQREAHHEIFHQRFLLRFAGILLDQQRRSTDLEVAHLVYNYVVDYWGSKSLSQTDRLRAVEATMSISSYRDVEGAFTRYDLTDESLQKQLFYANRIIAVNPAEDQLQNWLSEVNRAFDELALSPISLIDSDGSETHALFDRLDSTAHYELLEGPKVSILMPTFKTDDRIHTAIRSLLKQTWRNLEILIIDDGSSAEIRPVLEELSTLDDRIRVFFLEENEGAYIARNFGLEQATGEFITVHDDDDWSHPQKIEFQVKDLLENPARVANATQHVRTTEELLFVRLNNNPRLAKFNFSSIMFRKALVEEIGGWNNVNRNGDAEFKERIEAHSGTRIGSAGDGPMSFTRVRAASLTDGEVDRGYVDSSRLFYMALYQESHRRQNRDKSWSSASMELPPGIPENLKAGKRKSRMGHFDIIYATDFRFPNIDSMPVLAEIYESINAGHRVGLVQMGSPTGRANLPIGAEVVTLLGEAGNQITVLSLLDDATADLLILRDPTVAQYSDGLESNISATTAVVVVDLMTNNLDNTELLFSIDTVSFQMNRLFSAEVRTVASSMQVLDALRVHAGASSLEDSPWTGHKNLLA